jgi:hypothetical protein
VWTTQQWAAVFQAQVTAFRDAVGRADPAAPVPSCPGWTFTELTLHLGRFLQVATRYLATGSTSTLPPLPPPDTSDPLRYLDEQVAAAARAYAEVPPTRPVWTFSPAAPALAWVWHRRIAHEANLRRWDAQAALRILRPTDVEQAADGLDEALGTLLAAKYTGDVWPTAAGTALVTCTDLPRGWLVRFSAGGVPEVRPGVPGEPADLLLTGPASALYYQVWGRLELTAQGDEQLAWALRLD